MALIRFGGGVTEMRGSIAGTTFSRTRGGAIARGRTVPVNPNTLRQADNRALFAMVVASWAELGGGKPTVNGWNSWASEVELVNRLGEAYTPSGRQMYISVNMAKVTSGQEMLTNAPVNTNAPSPDAGIVQIDALTEAAPDANILASMQTNTLLAQPDVTVYFDATPPVNPGVTNVENLYRRIKTFTPTAIAEPLLAGYNAAFPEVSGGPNVLTEMIFRWRYRITTTSNPILSAYVYGSSEFSTP